MAGMGWVGLDDPIGLSSHNNSMILPFPLVDGPGLYGSLVPSWRWLVCSVLLYESCKVGGQGDLCFLTAPICVRLSFAANIGTTVAKHTLTSV